MELGPILRAITRNKIGAVLIALQVALTMAVVVNSWAMIEERLRLMGRPSGLVEDELFHISVWGFAKDFNGKVSVDDDLAMLRQTPGVVDAVAVNAVPLSRSGWSMGLQTEPGTGIDGISSAVYMVDDHGLKTLGAELIAGRDFAPEDVRERGAGVSDWPDKVILSKASATGLWPEDDVFDVIGRAVYINDDEPMTVIGIVDTLQAPWPDWGNVGRSMLVPDKLVWAGVRYLVRTAPNRRDELMPVVEEALARANRERIVRAPESMTETRQQGYMLESGLSIILAVVMVALVLVTTLGIVGLASFSVRRRTKQIGTRRALGARKVDILRYFLAENFLVTSAGVLLGIGLTVGFNIYLVQALNFPKIDWLYVPLGMIALWLIGLAAVLGPARRASAVAPAVATRTV